MKFEISANKREAQGTGASRRLRRMGKVPGIVYGGAEGPVNIELDHKDLFQNLRNEKFHASILSLSLAGQAQQVLLRAVNMHPFKLQVQHVDFQRVLKDKKIHMKVPLHFVNAEKSPGVKDQGCAGGFRGGRADHRADGCAEGRRSACRGRQGRRQGWRQGGRWRQGREEREEVSFDPPSRRSRQSGQGVRAHAPQRGLLAARALRAGQRHRLAQGCEIPGAGRQA
jgi:ribosomal protein L25 (general stress protein Ctc)